jgi:hypothetical protein
VAPDIPDMPQCDKILSEIIVTHTNVMHSKEHRAMAALSVDSVPEAQDGLDDQNLALHNSFDILNNVKERESGAALLEDMDV